jgi:hypothetical protein
VLYVNHEGFGLMLLSLHIKLYVTRVTRESLKIAEGIGTRAYGLRKGGADDCDGSSKLEAALAPAPALVVVVADGGGQRSGVGPSSCHRDSATAQT